MQMPKMDGLTATKKLVEIYAEKLIIDTYRWHRYPKSVRSEIEVERLLETFNLMFSKKGSHLPSRQDTSERGLSCVHAKNGRINKISAFYMSRSGRLLDYFQKNFAFEVSSFYLKFYQISAFFMVA